jgi:hypothetical protein
MSTSCRPVFLCVTIGVGGPAFGMSSLAAQSAVGPVGAILGSWRGSSICVDPARDTACRDEQVIYHVDSAVGPSGPVRMVADKVVNGSRQPMGGFQLSYDPATHVWSADLRMRVHARWSFEPNGDQMVGTLTDLPSGRLIRRVAVRRSS